MKLPNKVTSYKESTLSRFSPILRCLSKCDMSIYELYEETKKNYVSLTEYIDALDCLFALNQIEYFEEKEVLHYVV